MSSKAAVVEQLERVVALQNQLLLAASTGDQDQILTYSLQLQDVLKEEVAWDLPAPDDAWNKILQTKVPYRMLDLCNKLAAAGQQDAAVHAAARLLGKADSKGGLPAAFKSKQADLFRAQVDASGFMQQLPQLISATAERIQTALTADTGTEQQQRQQQLVHAAHNMLKLLESLSLRHPAFFSSTAAGHQCSWLLHGLVLSEVQLISNRSQQDELSAEQHQLLLDIAMRMSRFVIQTQNQLETRLKFSSNSSSNSNSSSSSVPGTVSSSSCCSSSSKNTSKKKGKAKSDRCQGTGGATASSSRGQISADSNNSWQLSVHAKQAAKCALLFSVVHMLTPHLQHALDKSPVAASASSITASANAAFSASATTATTSTTSSSSSSSTTAGGSSAAVGSASCGQQDQQAETVPVPNQWLSAAEASIPAVYADILSLLGCSTAVALGLAQAVGKACRLDDVSATVNPVLSNVMLYVTFTYNCVRSYGLISESLQLQQPGGGDKEWGSLHMYMSAALLQWLSEAPAVSGIASHMLQHDQLGSCESFAGYALKCCHAGLEVVMQQQQPQQQQQQQQQQQTALAAALGEAHRLVLQLWPAALEQLLSMSQSVLGPVALLQPTCAGSGAQVSHTKSLMLAHYSMALLVRQVLPTFTAQPTLQLRQQDGQYCSLPLQALAGDTAAEHLPVARICSLLQSMVRLSPLAANVIAADNAATAATAAASSAAACAAPPFGAADIAAELVAVLSLFSESSYSAAFWAANKGLPPAAVLLGPIEASGSLNSPEAQQLMGFLFSALKVCTTSSSILYKAPLATPGWPLSLYGTTVVVDALFRVMCCFETSNNTCSGNSGSNNVQNCSSRSSSSGSSAAGSNGITNPTISASVGGGCSNSTSGSSSGGSAGISSSKDISEESKLSSSSSSSSSVIHLPWLVLIGRCCLATAMLLLCGKRQLVNQAVCTAVPGSADAAVMQQLQASATFRTAPTDLDIGDDSAFVLPPMLVGLVELFMIAERLLCRDQQQLQGLGYDVQHTLEQLSAAVTLLGGRSEQLFETVDEVLAAGTGVAAVCNQLQSVGTALCMFAITEACNNPTCSNTSGPSEAQLVGGKSCMCGGCRTGRYCSKGCQKAHWKQHKPVC